MAPNSLRPNLPSTLGPYEVRAKIGEGGMAAVYVGYEPGGEGRAEPGRAVALKIVKEELAENPHFVDMFIDEGRMAATFSHPNVVRVLTFGNEAGRLYIAMELLRGQSLQDVWDAAREQGRRMSYGMAAWIAARIADGLHHAHEHRNAAGEPLGIVHRDVNPNNVFVTYDGEIKVIDFGLAKGRGRVTKTAAGVVKGKLAYLSPEAAAGVELDRRADIFALGTTLYELTTDCRLFKQPTDEETVHAVHAAVVPDPRSFVRDYPAALWGVVRRALARSRDDRHVTAAELARELDACAARGANLGAGAAAVAELMAQLFPHDRERQEEWLRTASAARPAALGQLKVPCVHLDDAPAAPAPPQPRTLPPLPPKRPAPLVESALPSRKPPAIVATAAGTTRAAAMPVAPPHSLPSSRPPRWRIVALLVAGMAVASAIAFLAVR